MLMVMGIVRMMWMEVCVFNITGGLDVGWRQLGKDLLLFVGLESRSIPEFLFIPLVTLLLEPVHPSWQKGPPQTLSSVPSLSAWPLITPLPILSCLSTLPVHPGQAPLTAHSTNSNNNSTQY